MREVIHRIFTPVTMFFAWYLVLFLTGCSCAKVHFEFTEDESKAIKLKRNSLIRLLEEGNIIGSKEYLCSNQDLLYNSFKELEEHLCRFLMNKSYEAASLLISEGIRITENVEIILNQIITDGNSEILATIFKHHKTRFIFLDFEKLLMLSVESGQLEVLKFFDSLEVVQTHCKSIYSKMAKMAIGKRFNDIFDYIIETRPVLGRIAFLSPFLKPAMSIGNFHVIKRCAENKVTFMVLSLDQRIEALRLAAVNDCAITTTEILKINSVVESVKNSCK